MNRQPLVLPLLRHSLRPHGGEGLRPPPCSHAHRNLRRRWRWACSSIAPTAFRGSSWTFLDRLRPTAERSNAPMSKKQATLHRHRRRGRSPARLKAKVVGQSDVVDAIARPAYAGEIAARRKDKPIAVFCLAGPPGGRQDLSRQGDRRGALSAIGLTCTSST